MMGEATVALFVGIGALVLALVALLALGAYVVGKYPNPADPARNAKRFTRPATALVLIGGGAAGLILTSIVILGFGAIS